MLPIIFGENDDDHCFHHCQKIPICGCYYDFYASDYCGCYYCDVFPIQRRFTFVNDAGESILRRFESST